MPLGSVITALECKLVWYAQILCGGLYVTNSQRKNVLYRGVYLMEPMND